ncbi:MAG: YkgJ family cysteine cluster protein [Candidatus Limivivens sp.]|nr:YkgJ family cysteine cluster protein [Candidatus Limivivens sp.]
MKRNVSLEEISDGKLYGMNDLVKAGCGDCAGCSACCRGMGESIILDPLDVFRLTAGLGITFDELMASRVELNVVDGIILPNLKMAGAEEKCSFLNEEGRCSIHPYRPGICRLFPLGRYYENHSFRYFLQVHECRKENRSKVKVRKWIDTPDIRAYEQYITDWHYFLEGLEEMLEQSPDNEALSRNTNLYLLKNFFQKPYDPSRDFYPQFDKRMEEAKKIFG